MPLTAGQTLGPYRVLAKLGEGGMGEVYRARDTKLNRDVALKVLPEAFAGDAERLARFTREAQTLAALNHPNIAAIYGIEGHALVMELVEGEDLSAHIARGPLPLREVLPIARQIAEALEAAHEAGIIHRDLKPANVKVRADGTVKVLDFGLAKALNANASGATSAGAANSPTLTAQATQLGMILGTAAYMAPEQARGKTVDRRADIWAFGAVVYEMLSGRRAFEGDDISDVLAAVLRQEVDWTALPTGTPIRLRRLLERCLDRDVKQRLRDIGEARIEIARIEGGAAETSSTSSSLVVGRPQASRWRRVLPWALLGLAGAGLVAAVAAWGPWQQAAARPPVRVLVDVGVNVGSGAQLFAPGGAGSPVALSPNGSILAFTATTGTTSANGAGARTSQLFVRRLDQLQATLLAGTDGAAAPFFSPDGQSLGFFTSGQLKKVPVTGGTVTTICVAANTRGGTWVDDDTIVFSPNAGTSGLVRVAAAGGTPVPVGTLASGMLTQRWPQALPGTTAVLYTEHRDITDFDSANLAVAPLGGGAAKTVVRGGYMGRYVPSGHLVYVHQGRLLAVRFDLARLETVGEAVPVLADMAANTNSGAGLFGVSSTGTLVYVPGAVKGQRIPIDWMTRDGQTSVLRATPADWENPQFSPDGQKLALDISDGTQRDIFVYEWAGDRLTQLTFDPSNERAPIWSPDGKRIVFASDRASPGIDNLYSIKADGTGGLERLTDSAGDQRPGSWNPTGRFLAFEETSRTGSARVMILPMNGDAATGWKASTPTVFVDLGTPAHQRVLTPSFSSDGRWIAYAGADGVYVRPFPGPGGQWKISVEPNAAAAGGAVRSPQWSPASHELLLVTGSRVLAAPYTVVGDEFRAGTAAFWSPTAYQLFGLRSAPYAVHPDGKRLAISKPRPLEDALTNDVVFVFNFFDELRRAVR